MYNFTKTLQIWENKGATHGLACLDNVKTSSNTTGKAHNHHDHPPTHTGYTFHCLTVYLHCLHIASLSLSNSLTLMSIPLLSGCTRLLWTWLGFCPCAIASKAQRTMKWTNGRLIFAQINNVAIKETIVA